MDIRKILVISLLYITIGLRDVDGESGVYVLNLPVEIVQALKSGDAKTISKYFNTSVELIFSESQGVYGKAQAEQILKNFFTNNASPGGSFSYRELHSGNRDNPQYYIGELHTGKGRYRVTIFMKDQRIHQMRVESND